MFFIVNIAAKMYVHFTTFPFFFLNINLVKVARLNKNYSHISCLPSTNLTKKAESYSINDILFLKRFLSLTYTFTIIGFCCLPVCSCTDFRCRSPGWPWWCRCPVPECCGSECGTASWGSGVWGICSVCARWKRDQGGAETQESWRRWQWTSWCPWSGVKCRRTTPRATTSNKRG